MANETLKVGIIQTSLDATTAWGNDSTKCWQSKVQISILEEKRAIKEIRYFLSSFKGVERQPDIVLLPELSVPIGYEKNLIQTAEAMESILIAGLDYRIDQSQDTATVSNEAVVIVPRKLNGTKIARRTGVRRVGKTYPSSHEMKKLNAIEVKFQSQPTVWLFESETLGNFAVTVCYDFVDLDRIVLYRNRIQTLFVLAYNRDITSFDHISEAIARMVFCNVVVCNCGYFGGSLAVSPFRKPYKRTIFRHSGKNLSNAQLIELPLQPLIEHQKSEDTTKGDFKSLPPGFSASIPLTIRNASL